MFNDRGFFTTGVTPHLLWSDTSFFASHSSALFVFSTVLSIFAMLSSLDVLLTDNCLTDVIKSSPLTLDGFLIFEWSLFFVTFSLYRPVYVFASLMYFFVVLVPLFSRGFVTECTWFRYVPLRWTLINVLKCSWTYLVGGCVPWTLLFSCISYSDIAHHLSSSSSSNKGS